MKRILFLVAVMMAILSLAGCKQDQGTDNDSTDSAASVTVPDPEGTVTVNITSSSFIYITNAPLRLSDGNLEVHNAAEDFRSLVSLGKGNGLGNLNTSNIPTSGWSSQCAAVSGNLYICQSKNSNLGTTTYCGIYVVSLNGSDSATIKYCAFKPGVGWK